VVARPAGTHTWATSYWRVTVGSASGGCSDEDMRGSWVGIHPDRMLEPERSPAVF
jgi:hypothetical protein